MNCKQITCFYFYHFRNFMFLFCSECAVATAKANVMLYDSKASTWIPSGPGHGISKVQLYHNTITNAYRVVGWRLQDREVLCN